MSTSLPMRAVHSPARLNSWKEVAAYLDRSVRTVARWEREEHLPVHRLPHDRRSSIYAYPRELDRWLAQRSHAFSGIHGWLTRLKALVHLPA